MTPEKCKSCGAAVVWAEMDSGKMMPLNATAEKRIVVTSGYALDGSRIALGSVTEVYTSHFATCPYAAKHRR